MSTIQSGECASNSTKHSAEPPEIVFATLLGQMIGKYLAKKRTHGASTVDIHAQGRKAGVKNSMASAHSSPD